MSYQWSALQGRCHLSKTVGIFWHEHPEWQSWGKVEQVEIQKLKRYELYLFCDPGLSLRYKEPEEEKKKKKKKKKNQKAEPNELSTDKIKKKKKKKKKKKRERDWKRN